MIIAAIGNIANFTSAATLKAYFGWAPRQEQTGKTYDRTGLAPTGSRAIKQLLFLVAMNAVRQDTEWAQLYRRLVPIKCGYDERTRSHRGKLKVIGRIAGQIIEMIYALLKHDAEATRNVVPGAEPSEPMLYDRATHQAHKNGKYCPIKRAEKPTTIVLVSKQEQA